MICANAYVAKLSGYLRLNNGSTSCHDDTVGRDEEGGVFNLSLIRDVHGHHVFVTPNKICITSTALTPGEDHQNTRVDSTTVSDQSMERNKATRPLINECIMLRTIVPSIFQAPSRAHFGHVDQPPSPRTRLCQMPGQSRLPLFCLKDSANRICLPR